MFFFEENRYGRHLKYCLLSLEWHATSDILIFELWDPATTLVTSRAAPAEMTTADMIWLLARGAVTSHRYIHLPQHRLTLAPLALVVGRLTMASTSPVPARLRQNLG